ncbi:uncharacterized protein LOC122306264 [Carya illinoinensis]|uniref:uncharacterized protein LOC122306264 n=1 Tax=Carya illinoinensis TaxID=32201 RepID=UPI001C7246E2|nr:uncharacterized protein LOC122306264 [Carya illinoinensis]
MVGINSDYQCDIKYHPEKAKVVADALSRKSRQEASSVPSLEVSPMRGVSHFAVKSKLSPRYVGPYEIVEKVGVVAYCLELPTEFHGIHNVFYVSSLKKSFGNQTPMIVDPDSIPLQSNLTYEEKPMQIIDWKDKELWNCKIPLVKVL